MGQAMITFGTKEFLVFIGASMYLLLSIILLIHLIKLPGRIYSSNWWKAKTGKSRRRGQ